MQLETSIFLPFHSILFTLWTGDQAPLPQLQGQYETIQKPMKISESLVVQQFWIWFDKSEFDLLKIIFIKFNLFVLWARIAYS